MMKKTLAALLAAITTLSLAACGGSSIESDDPFQKNMHQSDYYRLHHVCETEDGYYISYTWVYYIDKETKNITVLCAKPDCAHNDETCNAYLGAGSLWVTDDRLYYTNSTLLEEGGELVDYGDRVYSVALDGTDQRVVQALEFDPENYVPHVTIEPILHRGYVYFVYNGVLYRSELGGKITDAERIWGEETEPVGKQEGNLYIYDTIPVNRSYTLWADGDFVYFMVNLQQPDGTYKDTLFAYHTMNQSVKQVWQTPDADKVGEWTSTGVAVSKWYIIDGYLYFYLSGGDYWRSSLETGQTEKLADTHEKTQYGKAIFADEYMCLLNAVPEDRSLPGFEIVGGDRYDYNSLVGGDTFYVYGLDGSFVKELPLESLYGERPDIVSVEPIFCANGEIWFVAEQEHSTGDPGVEQNGFLPFGGVKTYDYTLCCVEIETGELTQVINWHRD